MALSFCGKKLLLSKGLFTLSKRHGYIVLVPEIGEGISEKNPLPQSNGLPEFNNITVEHCVAAMGKQAYEFESGVKNIEKKIIQEKSNDIFSDVLQPLEILCAQLNITWGLAKTLYLSNSSLMPTKCYLNMHNRAKAARALKYNSVPIFNAIKESINSKTNYTDEQVRLLQKFELEGKLNGLELDDNNKSTLDVCMWKLAEERTKFNTKTESSTKAHQHRIEDFQIVKNFPVNLQKAMAKDATNYHKGPWFATLQPQIYLPFMEYCPDRQLRLNLWLAMVIRGSTVSNKLTSTSVNLEEIRQFRKKQANLLGYATFADLSMETKMAKSVDNIKNYLDDLLESAKPVQKQELMNIYEFALQGGFNDSRLELWDVPYWRRKYQLSVLNYKEEEFQDYFPLPKVLDGLFKLCKELFQVTIKQRDQAATWNKDVPFYDIFEVDNDTPIAGFYLDPYFRKNQKIWIPNNNGWMISIQNQSKVTKTKPLAALIFNFEPPIPGKPAFLSFKDVNALFHKFGQSLQHLLTQTTYSEVSGSSNIEWDAIEVCGYVFTHWLYNKSVMDTISSHKDNGEKLSTEMFTSLISSKNHTAGLDLCSELYLSALDLELHSSKEFWLQIVKNLWPKYRCFPLHKFDSHPCSFTQIVTEEGGASYYSNIWVRIIAADIYSAFHEVRNDKQELSNVGKRFRDTFLALGGSCNSNEVFRKFRGRDPSPRALLSSLGLKSVKNENNKINV